ncbi:YdgH/BhsA/McbA-like domain containing protein [Yersinia frederiksenii]|uniref:YdgH/BhsA/McbA-like domain containing protein n=1 Tax=Yersinia frederiksenii TaxID=29484 RepID=UPI0005E82B61|nr:YdgH/BhsA/McbA-like domain containing protein [Yersinia frederiksenii]CFR09417.1 putative lipoprotein [Yersinia frederiksenii]
MKLLPVIVAALIATASFTTIAAQEVSPEQAIKLQSMGVISLSNVSGSPMDVESALKAKAIAGGASHYRIIGISNPGDSSNYSASAEIYH